MPTRNRPQFVRQAVASFARQTHAPAELVVVDDGDEPVEHLCYAPRIRYIRTLGDVSLGAKMNLGIDQAAGEYIIKWDDDDWHHDDFNGTMLEALLGSANPDTTLAACGCVLVFMAGDTILRRTPGGLTVGGTLTFTKTLWRRTPFRDLGVEEDYWFRVDTAAEIVRVNRPELYVVVRHGRNTWVKSRDGRRNIDRVWQQLPRAAVEAADLFSSDELEFYLSLPALRNKGSEPLRRAACSVSEP
jgi:glycosyltransferase involved in cell wall biosynthesis